jgi:hypothetical protein
VQGGILTSNTAMTQTKNHHSIMNSLLRGEITEEVEKLRWRMYSTSSAMAKIAHKVVGFDNEGFPILKQIFIGDESRLNKIKTDEEGDKLIMVVDNTPVQLSSDETLNMVNDSNLILSAKTFDVNNFIMTNFLNEEGNDITDEELNDTDKHGRDSNINLGELTSMSAVTIAENIKIDNTKERTFPLTVSRELKPKFEIEKYTRKLHIKEYGDKYLLEFYVSKYPEEFDATSRFFISNIKKLKENPRKDSILEIDTVHFVSDNTVGVPDFLEFEYKIEKFHNITEFKEYLVIKFIADVTKNGDSIIEKYRNSDLDEKYKNKEKR